MGNAIRTNANVANHHRREMATRGGAIQQTIPSVTNGSSTAAVSAHNAGIRLNAILIRYDTAVRDSADRITILSDNIVNFDIFAGRQFNNRGGR